MTLAKRRWKRFQQATGWILGPGETAVLLVGGYFALKIGIPLYFWFVMVAGNALIDFGAWVSHFIVPSM